MRYLAVLLVMLATAGARGVELNTGDFLTLSDAGALLHVDAVSGDRTEISNPGPPMLGAGPEGVAPAFFGFDIAVLPSQDTIAIPERVLNGTGGAINFIVGVDPATGDRTVLSSEEHVAECVAPSDPLACCTGAGTGDGTPPCAAIGTGPGIPRHETLAVVPPPAPAVLSALPAWGAAALVGLVVGLSIRMRRG